MSTTVDSASAPAAPRLTLAPTLRRLWGSAPLMAAIAYAGIMLAVMPGVLASEAGALDTDFSTMFSSAQALTEGRSPYVPTGAHAELNPNLNHPATIVAMAPLTAMSQRGAFWVWTTLSILAFAALAAIVSRQTTPFSGRAVPTVVALVAAFPGALFCLQLGQMGLFFGVGVALVWRWARQQRWGVAGLLVGVLVALKLFLFPLAFLFLRRDARRGLWTGAAGALGVSAAALPFVGVDGYAQWLSTMTHVDWLANPMNVSVSGLLDRLAPGPLPGWAPYAVTLVVVAAALAATLRRDCSGSQGHDRDFSLLVIAALLASPLGWLYYLPILAPVAVILRDRWARLSRTARAAAVVGGAFLWIPYIATSALPDAGPAALTGATYTYGILLIAIALAVRPARLASGVSLANGSTSAPLAA